MITKNVYYSKFTGPQIEQAIEAMRKKPPDACPHCGAPRTGAVRCEYCRSVLGDPEALYRSGAITRNEMRELLGMEATPDYYIAPTDAVTFYEDNIPVFISGGMDDVSFRPHGGRGGNGGHLRGVNA